MVLKNMRNGSEKKPEMTPKKYQKWFRKIYQKWFRKKYQKWLRKISEMVPKKYAPFRNLVGICIFALSGFHFAYNRCTKTKAL